MVATGDAKVAKGDHPTKEAIMAGSYPLPSAGASTKDWSYVKKT